MTWVDIDVGGRISGRRWLGWGPGFAVCGLMGVAGSVFCGLGGFVVAR